MKLNVFSKSVERLLMVLLCISSVFLAGCSNDDDEENDAIGNTDYIEVTVNGKTYRESVPNFLYATIGTDTEGLDLSYSTVDCFSKKGFSCFYGLVHATHFNDLAKAKPGTYNVTDEISNNVELFDFSIFYEKGDNGEHYDAVSGTNHVTSVTPQQENDAVIIEGYFDAKMEEMDSYESFRMKGKYRITIFCD